MGLDYLLNSGNSTVSSKNGYFYLCLDSVTADDVGEYEAIATNAAGQAASRFLLVVDEGPEEHFPPRFLSQLRNQELRGSERNLLLHTKISASPCVSVSWYRNGCKVRPSSGVHKYFDRDGNATLAVVEDEDGPGVEGNYTCVASNEGGENTISVQVSRARDGEQDEGEG